MYSSSYSESKEYLRPPIQFPQPTHKAQGPVQPRLLQYVLNNSQQGNPVDVIKKIDTFCQFNWMMNLGSQKGLIVRQQAFHKDVFKVLQIGGYCGYSALVFANQIKDKPNAKVYTIEINKYYADIARKIHKHAGLQDIIEINVGTVESSLQLIKQKGPFDLIFIDHIKNAYLSDLKLIQSNGGIKKKTVVVGDNIIYPGAPQYLDYFKKSQQYSSKLYHSYLQYSNDPDAVLISTKN